MKSDTGTYGRSLTRLLHELTAAISERNAYNQLCSLGIQISNTFFYYASVALKNDMCAHAIKVLDQSKDTSSFWYVYKCRKESIDNELRARNLTIEEIQGLAHKLRIVRNKTHFHIDRKRVFRREMSGRRQLSLEASSIK